MRDAPVTMDKKRFIKTSKFIKMLDIYFSHEFFASE